MRIALELKYDGGNYHGWQCQNNVDNGSGSYSRSLHKTSKKKNTVLLAVVERILVYTPNTLLLILITMVTLQ